MSRLLVALIIDFYIIVACLCREDLCPQRRSNVINVHLIPHSHDDVGWKETVDEYYNQGQIQVKQIYDSVVEALLENPKRR